MWCRKEERPRGEGLVDRQMMAVAVRAAVEKVVAMVAVMEGRKWKRMPAQTFPAVPPSTTPVTLLFFLAPP